MPELPEVETIARDLRASVQGQRIQRVEVLRPSLIQGDAQAFGPRLQGKRIQTIRRRGKYLLLDLEKGPLLVGHLGMTGKFVYQTAAPLPPVGPHERVRFWLEQGLLAFVDVRCFGFLELVDQPQEYPALVKMGPDAWEEDLKPKWFFERAQKSRSPIKAWLLDQSHLAGLGNIYVAELLFRVGISPQRPANQIKAHEWKALLQETKILLKQALAANGTSISDYRRVDDKTGEFQNFLQVYQKEAQPCPQCQTPIQRLVQAGRSSFFCPSCQS